MNDLTAWNCGHLTKILRRENFDIREWDNYLQWANQTECPNCRSNTLTKEVTCEELIEWSQK